MPHVIISGMPGIGKTTSILCLARQMLGDAYKEAVLELNASDERGGGVFFFFSQSQRCFLFH
jgi:replication factor C subunit 2/4